MVLSAPTRGIASLRKTNREELIALIITYIEAFMIRISVHNKMTPTQMGLCAVDIVDELYWLKPEDIDLCLRMAARGDFGQLEYKVDQSDIFRWLKGPYRTMRELAARDIESEGAKNIMQILTHPQVADAVKMVSDKIEERTNRSDEVRQRAYSPNEKKILNEWDANGDETGAGQFKRFDGVYYSFTDYANKRMKELVELQTGIDNGREV